MSVNLSMLRRMASKVIVPYAEEHALIHMDFAARMWPHNERRRSPRYNSWKYRGSGGDRIERHLLALWDGQVVGQVGLTPVQARVNGQAYPAQWICDFMVDPSYRLKGFGPMLLAEVISNNVLTLGENPTAMSSPLLKRFGFRELAGPHRMLLPLKADHILSWKAPQKFRRLIPLAALLARPFLFWRSRKLLSGAVREKVTPCRWNELPQQALRRQIDSHVPHIVHDRSFLEWRCPGVPGFSNEMRGLRTANGDYVLIGEDHPYLYVFDWSAANEDHCRALFSCVYTAAKELCAHTISVLVNTPQEHAWLQRLGFLTVPTPVQIYCYPSHQLGETSCFNFCHYDSGADL